MKYTEQLRQILKLSSWSQEQLASKLGVSFPALNAWVNGRSIPRAKAQQRISLLYTQIVGAPEVSEADVREKSQSVLVNTLSAHQIVSNKHLLDTLTLHLTYHCQATNIINN